MVRDLIGVDFGPSSIALAVALQKRTQAQGALEMLSLGKRDDYCWHGNTLVSQSELQISFLKGLVSLRNPTSPYSLVDYLHKHDRLIDFIGLGTFYPYQMEFNDYLRWVASHFQEQSRYGEEVLRIEPMLSADRVGTLRMISCNADGEGLVRTTHALVVSPGDTPRTPQVLRTLKGGGRVFHHNQHLGHMVKQFCSSGKPMKIAIIGDGQSAAEAFINLNDSYPSVQADMILHASTLKPANDSPSISEVFVPKFADLIYSHGHAKRERLLYEYHNTNYLVMDTDLIERIYGVFYRQKISGIPRRTFRYMTTVERATAAARGIELALRDVGSDGLSVETYDAVILATGYERQLHRQLLGPLAEYPGDHKTGHDYRLQTDERCKVTICAQGSNQTSHGLSDTLLSVLPVRAEEISGSLYQHLKSDAPARVLHGHTLAS